MPDPDLPITLDGQTVPVRTNGHTPTHTGILDHERETVARRRIHREDTAMEVDRRTAELDELRALRHGARLELAARLGDFGLIYHPETNSLQRPAVIEPAPPAPAEMRGVPALFEPKAYGLPERAPREFAPKLMKWIDAISWAAVLFIGPFLGFSIGLLAGLPVKAQPIFAAMSVLFGVFVLAAMKGSLYAIVHHAVRRATVEASRTPSLLAFAAAAILVLAEAGLGTVAVVRYSQDRSVTPDDVIPVWQAALIALTFSTPILLASIAKGWADGREHRDLEESARLEAERYHREKGEAQREHDAAERTRIADAVRKHEEALARFEAANAAHRENPRWQAAMALFGAIATYDVEIAERERQRTSTKISLGYEASALKREA